MIKATEIRLGNYFYTDDLSAVLQCFGITPNDDTDKFNFWYANELGFYLDETEIKPISLTEEWLFKFGFENKQPGLFVHEVLERGSINIHFSKKQITVELGTTGHYLFGITPIKYVHEIQNLIQSLTGKELTIK